MNTVMIRVSDIVAEGIAHGGYTFRKEFTIPDDMLPARAFIYCEANENAKNKDAHLVKAHSPILARRYGEGSIVRSHLCTEADEIIENKVIGECVITSIRGGKTITKRSNCIQGHFNYMYFIKDYKMYENVKEISEYRLAAANNGNNIIDKVGNSWCFAEEA